MTVRMAKPCPSPWAGAKASCRLQSVAVACFFCRCDEQFANVVFERFEHRVILAGTCHPKP